MVSRALKRAAAAKLPYLSLEIRFPLMKPMLRELALNPEAGMFCNSAKFYANIVMCHCDDGNLEKHEALADLATATEGIETFEGIKRIIL